jgi:hypothetical protein
MAEAASKPITFIWIWLWDALQLLLKHCPRPLAEQKLARAIISKEVTSMDIVEGREILGGGRRLFKRLSGSTDRRLHSPAINWEESWIEAYDQHGRCRVYVQVAQEDVLRLCSPQLTMPVSEQSDDVKANDQSGEGWQEERVEMRLNALETAGVVLKQKTRTELRRLVEGKFKGEREEMLAQGLSPPPPTPSRRVINAVIKKRLSKQ